MTIRIYNTLTRKKETFKPLEEGKISMYVCGPTVYNYIHIGNARPALVFDTVRRYFEYKGYHVDYVLNFTDVDDKLIKAANEMGEEMSKVADRFIDAYRNDVQALGVKEATYHPRVTESMDDIILFVKKLIEKGYAYEADGDVYFKTRAFDGYGKLSHQSIDDLRSGARIQVGDKKEDPLDFALWKNAKPGEISWDTPWGTGRPGWHIECSAMAKKYLGDTIDIHAGGQDLAFPHHENEIAQSEAYNDKNFANYWMHNGYITIDDEKMSKSLGNFVLAHDLVQKFDPQLVRFFMLSVHYRNPINFSESLLENAKSGLDRIKNAYQNLQHRKQASLDLTDDTREWLDEIKQMKQSFMDEMDDDFNTANAIAVIFDVTKQANLYLQQNQTATQVIDAFTSLFTELLGTLGIEIDHSDALLDEEIDQMIKQREEARRNRDFQLADQIRDELKERNIILEDTPQGARWKRG
ncbi:cysteine--tRNA ligase [Paraliobacillus ryukyuensis]|uniref:Cysteine--tRNA ligase n=1 Tax=Paraliobacillus ryukyuensis TaxID=200904 RepID=A0A366DUW5_9BACI|nr:cysteine--tRNA ligase [Paraliobacillus ryukyuensis]RBO93279.1 cysteinyl-tRNA synthetase [Paraliobacillus ryukyuensis]